MHRYGCHIDMGNDINMNYNIGFKDMTIHNKYTKIEVVSNTIIFKT